jgi:HAMP domain-containing protein
VIVIGVTLLGAAVAGAVLVRRELRPLDRVADTAAKVSALPLYRGEVELAERVHDVDPLTEVGQVATALNQMLDNVGGALGGWCRTTASGVWSARLAVHRAPGFAEIGRGSGSVEPLEERFGPPVAAVSPR